MALTEQPVRIVPSLLDADCPSFRAALAALCGNLSSQLTTVGYELTAVSGTPWQLLPVARRLDGLREAVDFLRKEVSRLKPKDVDDPFA